MRENAYGVHSRVIWFRWHTDKPYRTRLRLVRYGLSECHLNPYRTRMDVICISYVLNMLCGDDIHKPLVEYNGWSGTLKASDYKPMQIYAYNITEGTMHMNWEL